MHFLGPLYNLCIVSPPSLFVSSKILSLHGILAAYDLISIAFSMNWTGGRLSRHSGSSNPVKARQKQHFAKVQQALRSGPKNHSPIKWTFFDHVVGDRERSQRETSAARHTTLQAYDHRDSQSNRKHHGHLTSTGHAAQQSSSRHSSQSLEITQGRQILVPVMQQPKRVPTDDLYNATPPPREAERKQEESAAVSEMKNIVDQEEESLSEKRRKILRKGDWVGVTIQRPLRLSFTSPRKEENIGRRRKITDGHRARYSSKQLHITSPFPNKRGLLVNQRSSQGGPQNREPPRADVRISIGGRVVPPGVSSSSAPRRMGSHSTTAHRRSQTTSSDMMLLDPNASAGHESPRVPSSNLAAIRYSMGSHQRIHNQDFSLNNTSLALGLEQGHHIPYVAEDSANGWAIRNSETASEPEGKDQHPVGHQNNLEPHPNTRHVGITPAPENNNHYPRRLIFSSSTASIHHPAPQSSRVSVLLRSASSDVAESTMAQVGKNKPVIPSSQVLENEIWETWIAPEKKYDYSSDCNEQGSVLRVPISPGVSTSHAPWHVGSEGDDVEDEDSLELQMSDSEEPTTSPRESNIPVSGILDEVIPLSPELIQFEFEGVEVGAENPRLIFSPANKEPPKAIPLALPRNSFMEDDPNESWMKLLFGGMDDEVDASFPSPERIIMPNQKTELLGTSMLGQSSGDRSAISDLSPLLQHTTTPAAPSSISRGASRITETRSSPSVSRHRESQFEMASTVNSPPSQGGVSVQAEKGSIFVSSSDSVSTSETAQAVPQYSTPKVVETTNLYRPQRKVTFTRPKPFIGRKAKLDSIDQSESLHIGRGSGEEDADFERGRKRKRNVGYFAGSDEQDEQEGVESIEDD
jgi:hypothetical protein